MELAFRALRLGGVQGLVAAGWRIVEEGCSAPFILIPHEVGECHRLWRVSFGDFVCFLGEEAEEGADVVCYSATSCVNSA